MLGLTACVSCVCGARALPPDTLNDDDDEDVQVLGS